MYFKTVWLPALFAGLSLAAAPEAKLNDPYGVCAHVSLGELSLAPKEFPLMREAGINWVRTDFSWSWVEKKRNQWNFDHFDKLMRLVRQEKMNILPILNYDVPWATPAWKNLDAWSEYVRRVVSRYSKDLSYWEVWNEQNIDGFWRDKADGENYTRLLRRTCEEIRKINPNLKILYGGTSGVPLGFIEKSFAAGAGQ